MGINIVKHTEYTLSEIQIIIVDYLKKNNVEFETATEVSKKIVEELNDLSFNPNS